MIKDKTNLVILFFCVVKLALHLVGDFNTGFQGDELLHIATGNHPDFGYMEFPPLIGWLAFVQNQFQSQSVFVHHIFSHIASLSIFILVALSTIQLGGKTKAVFIVLLCMLIAPAFGRGHQLFQPVVFSQFFWVLSFYQLLRFVKTLDGKYLFYLTLSVAFGFLTKYNILFFIAGLSGLLFFERTRSGLLTKSVWKYILLFILLISPNVWWQYQHGFPVFQMFSRLYETQLDQLSVWGVMEDLIISLNPLTAIIWIGGFVFMFHPKEKMRYRPLAISIVVSICILAFSKGKAYYFFPAIITLMMFGSVWFERKILEKRKWAFYPSAFIFTLSGLVLIPFGLAVMPLKSFMAFAQIEKENNHYEIDYTEYYSRSKWKKTMMALKEVYDSLPETEKRDCLIWGKHYSQAGGVNLFRKDYGLPAAFSYHGSFYLWTPKKGNLPETIIAFTNGEAEIDFFQSLFNTVTPVKKVYNPYADFDEDLWQTIYVCKDPKLDFSGLRTEFRPRVFE